MAAFLISDIQTNIIIYLYCVVYDNMTNITYLVFIDTKYPPPPKKNLYLFLDLLKQAKLVVFWILLNINVVFKSTSFDTMVAFNNSCLLQTPPTTSKSYFVIVFF